MSNIGKTSANIKKKLSLGDYSKSARQQDSKKIEQPTSKQARQTTVKQLQQQTVIPASQQENETKTKATYYLGKQEIEMLTHLYIKQLKQHNKGDKSSIICEAIRLIFERDK